MESGNHVGDKYVVKRRKPPVAQPQEDYDHLINELGKDLGLDFGFLDEQQGPGNENAAHVLNTTLQSDHRVAEHQGNDWGFSEYGAPSTEPLANALRNDSAGQVLNHTLRSDHRQAEHPGNDRGFSEYGPPLTDPHSNAPYYCGPTYDQRILSGPPVNSPAHARPPDTYGDPISSHGGQTTAHATFNLHDFDPTLTLPHLGSHLEPHHSGHQDIYSNPHYAPHALYPPPSLGNMGDPLRDPALEQSNMLPMWTTASSPPTAPKSSRKRRRCSTESFQAVEQQRVRKQCAGCDKPFGTSKDPERLRCSRCYDKFVKNNAGHTTYTFDPNFTLEHARQSLYPHFASLRLPGDDVGSEIGNEQHYLRRLVDAITEPYFSDGSDSKEDRQRVAQQTKLNKKPYDSKQYTNVLINARVRFLWQIAVSYHAGGESMYDSGGDNSGYGEDRTLKFSERLERIIDFLTLNKDIAMDVIEGRGVTALVQNPNKYERRKRDNKKSNDTKQDLQEKGKQLHALEAGGASGSSATPFPADPGQGPASMRQAHSHTSAGMQQQQQQQFSGTIADLALPTTESALQYEGKGKRPDVPEGYEPAEWR